MINLHFDFETYCDLDLKLVGVHRYVAHPSFKILCVAWKVEGGLKKSALIPADRNEIPGDLRDLLKDPDVQAHAWNAAFETAVIDGTKCAFLANPISCTMQRALAYGLPARLEYAANALGLSTVKNKAGHRLMLRMTRPQKKPVIWTAADWANLLIYCEDDVEAEEGIGEEVPPLPHAEAQLATLDRHMNLQGIGVDLNRVAVLIQAAEDAEKGDAARCAALTGGAVTSPGTQTQRLTAWLHDQGMVDLPDIARATIEEALDNCRGTGDWPRIEEVLRIRLRMARASTKKLARMTDMAVGGRLLGQFQFHGAGRTGRWSGRGVQVQNLPRVPKGFDPDAFCELARASANLQGPGLDMMAPAPVLDCVSWSLRSCLTGWSSGQAFFGEPYLWGFDFSQIEARVLAWLAGQQDVLDVFAAGEDVYVWAAKQFGSTDRQLGKVLILALGYGMGAQKLRDTARKAYGVTLTFEQAERFKNEWRARNANIVSFWYAMENAARNAISTRGKRFEVAGTNGRVAFKATRKTLRLLLPSQRVLYYHQPSIDRDGHIEYYGAEAGGRWTDQYTYGGKLAENATQAVARDIMAEAKMRILVAKAMIPVMTVHDEIVYPVGGAGSKGGGTVGQRIVARRMMGQHFADQELLRELTELALEPPVWSEGLPIAGEAKLMSRYGVLLQP